MKNLTGILVATDVRTVYPIYIDLTEFLDTEEFDIEGLIRKLEHSTISQSCWY